ncbi:hypothetical protein VL04_11425 [Chromobacterium violaceum]|uniref:hypothetical protein n=1 Tax=Chromobacterium violaceum TaxID=536 RepID=UPI000652DACD|nr:hypothetical protein [Chromobacterium violaceum]KMN49919.1 hypothetical protein VK93_09010 [Chromobacterium violaceum]KMN84873.1 hypothetical protein VL02_17405 [Chromobacterium violaceum]KMN90282.1 hypothetical protein VL04_11425 [Chromobacterium violaceum]KMO01888.1 hypothetical protein VL16_20940 [Chromobacterium violaceum]
MKLSLSKWPALIALLLSAQAHAASETIVLLRHGEKPAQGLGQINCQGLNRALALPQVLSSAFGAPDAIFAPDPATQVSDSGNSYYYVRPLATIEPTAIRLGMPVNTAYGFTQTSDLAARLLDADYANATVFVAWEHKKIVTLAKQIFANLKQSANIPSWSDSDYDSLYVITINGSGSHRTASLSLRAQGLNGQSTACPGPN